METNKIVVPAGAAVLPGGVVLDLMRMKSKKLFKEDMHVTVEPGVKKSELNQWLEPEGLLFGPDPASNPSIGGMASTSGSGLSTIMYGTTSENVVSLQVVTPSGELIQTRSRVRKSSTGYNLTALYLGAEGTLGVIVGLTLKLHRLPRVRSGAFVVFESIDSAAEAVIGFVHATLLTLCRCELLNADGMDATNKKYNTSLDKLPTIFLEFRGESAAACEADAAVAERLAKTSGAREFQFTSEGSKLDKLWEARRGCYLAAMSYNNRSGDAVYLSDTCVPISRIAEMISTTEQDFKTHGFPCIICAHIADGNFHCCIPYGKEEKARVQEVEHRMISRAVGMGGTVSGEHGVGVGKMAEILQEHGQNHIDLQRAIKRALDPKNVCNPGKIFAHPRNRKSSTAGSPQQAVLHSGHDFELDSSAGTYTHD